MRESNVRESSVPLSFLVMDLRGATGVQGPGIIRAGFIADKVQYDCYNVRECSRSLWWMPSIREQEHRQ
jgi:hypothetical protein